MTTRSSDLWFSDGNIVLQAGNTQFKVFQGILAVRSPIFRDMLAMPQAADVELVEGCPLVHMPDEEADAVAFLNAIYHPSSFPSYPNPTTLDTILGCLSLAHKYEVDDLRRRALVHLSSGFPSSLKWLDTISTTKSEEMPFPWRRTWDPAMKNSSVALLRLIRVANVVGAVWILPITFLQLSATSDPLTILDDLTAVDVLGPLREFRIRFNSMLLAADQRTTIAFSDPVDVAGCTNPPGCRRARLLSINELQTRMGVPRVARVAPLRLMGHAQSILERKVNSGDLCSPCGEALRVAQRERFESFWNSLPGLWNLPTWPELEVMKNDALGSNIFV
ncbi:ABC transporter protein [Mycena chlorophos]|uniref:ABC transporter protein n=1 Tax=Mycena chlorophos TaxID=658473 RepID=A0A8H6TVC7_MYCCL|nr:ABC transporter protein [Mycena chlorophos]